MKTLIETLGKYAAKVPEDSPPDIFPIEPDDLWGLDGSAGIAIGLLLEEEQPGPRLYEMADYLLTFYNHDSQFLGFSNGFLLNGTALALIGYICEGHHTEAELWRVSGGARLASMGHWYKASLSNPLLPACLKVVCSIAQEKQLPICGDLISLQERIWGKLVDHSQAEWLHVPGRDYARHMIDHSQAENLGELLRNRDWQYDIDIPESQLSPNLREADDACNNLITFHSHTYIRHQFCDEIDWNLRLFDDKETTVSLASHYFIANLAIAYANTGKGKYAYHAARSLESFYRLAPVTNYRQLEGPWRSLEVGRRQAIMWPKIISTTGKTESFTPAIHEMLAYSRLDHMRYLTTFCGYSHNWLQVEAAALATAALFSPELRHADAYLRIALRRLRWLNSYAFYDDGLQFELSHCAHAFASLALFGVIETAHARGVALPQDFVDLVEKANEVYLYASMPDYHFPTFSDTYSFMIDASAELKPAAKTFDRKDFLWVATHGKQGCPPKHTSYAWPSAGHYLMRDKWGEDGEYLLFDGAAWGANHQHEDKLNFCIYAQGRQLIADPGIYSYSATELTHYFKSARAHNTILIDGREQARRLLPESKLNRFGRNEWVTAKNFDFVSSEYIEGFARNPFGEVVSRDEIDSSITHRRAIFYVKPGYWILCDLIKGNDNAKHTLEQLFQIAPLETPDAEASYTAGQIEMTDKAIITTDAGLGNIAIIPVPDSPVEISLHKGELTPTAGWWGIKGEYPAWTVDIKAETSLPARMDAVLYPLASGQSEYPTVERLACDNKTTAFRIKGEDFDDTFILCEDAAGPVTVDDITFEGRALLIRRVPELIAYAVAPVLASVGGETITTICINSTNQKH